MPARLPADTAEGFLTRLTALRDGSGSGRVAMREIFGLAKEFVAMAPYQIEQLLERPEHDARVGAVSVMDWRARSRSTPDARRRELYALYLRRLVDFLDRHATTMPRTALRYAVEHLGADERKHYLGLRTSAGL